MKRRAFSPVPADSESPTEVSSPAASTRAAAKKHPFTPPMLLPQIGGGRPTIPVSVDDAQVSAESPLTPEQEDTNASLPPLLVARASSHDDVAYQAVWIDAFSIDENQHAPRQQYPDSTILDLATSILEKGQRDAVHVIPNPNKPGRFIIGDGWTRVQAIRARNLQDLKVKAVIHHGLSEVDVAWLGYWQNEERNEHTDFDRATFYNKLRAEGWTWEDISKKTDIPVGTLSVFANYTKLDLDILDFAKRYPKKVTLNVVAQLVRMTEAKDRDAALSLCKTFVENDETIRWLRDRVQAAIERKKPERKSSSVKFQRRYASGMFRQRTDGSIEISGTIPQDRLEEFNAAMDRLLQPYFGTSESSPSQTPDANENS